MTIAPYQKDICPHCKTPNRFEKVLKEVGSGFQESSDLDLLNGHSDYHTDPLKMCRCTHCGEIIIQFKGEMIYPLGSKRPPCPKEVPQNIAEDYTEACLVEQLSKKAAVALARRCLQNLLHEQGISKQNLSEEIDEAIIKLPTHLSKAIDAIRIVGNFATHPIKSQQTGNIFDVEEGEAEWTLDVLEQLFDFYYVQPSLTNIKRVALNFKLKEAGKPPLK